MTIEQITGRLETIKSEYVQGNMNSDELIESIEDILHDVEGNDGLSWSAEHYESFEDADFTKLENM